MMFRSKADLEKYPDSKYLVATSVAEAVLDHLESMTTDQQSFLLSFMHHARLTACFEILQPSYQHVVDLSFLDKPRLKFITWTQQYGVAASQESQCAVPPHVALDLAREMGLDSVQYQVVAANQAEQEMER